MVFRFHNPEHSGQARESAPCLDQCDQVVISRKLLEILGMALLGAFIDSEEPKQRPSGEDPREVGGLRYQAKYLDTGSVPQKGVGREDALGVAHRSPPGTEVQDGRDHCLREQDVAGQIAVDELRGAVDRSRQGAEPLQSGPDGLERFDLGLFPSGTVGPGPAVVEMIQERWPWLGRKCGMEGACSSEQLRPVLWLKATFDVAGRHPSFSRPGAIEGTYGPSDAEAGLYDPPQQLGLPGNLLGAVSSFENHITHPIGRVQPTREDHRLARQAEGSQHSRCRADLFRMPWAAHRFVARTMRNMGTRPQRWYLRSSPEGCGSCKTSITIPARWQGHKPDKSPWSDPRARGTCKAGFAYEPAGGGQVRRPRLSVVRLALQP